ncbi:hypothetical protein Avbf_17307 [Armadillidium vulgare]|nr:hypothetical protein Avbf_17307 [Armadillidium vulgare]
MTSITSYRHQKQVTFTNDLKIRGVDLREFPQVYKRKILLTTEFLHEGTSSNTELLKKVICTLESIDSIKSLKRSPQHIFVEVSYF